MVKVFLDSANFHDMVELQNEVSGFTTNPTLCRKAGVTDYLEFCGMVVERFPRHSVSLEVVADDVDEMVRQARLLAAENVFVKVPIVNSSGELMGKAIRRIHKFANVNVTCMFTTDHVRLAEKCLNQTGRAILSIFAGRIADTGVDPAKTVQYAVKHSRPFRGWDVLWASPRSVGDYYRAQAAGADVITMTAEQILKLQLKDKDLNEFARETSAMFWNDAQTAGYTL